MIKSKFTPNQKLANNQLLQIKGGNDTSTVGTDQQAKGTPVSGSTSIARPSSV